jgi:Fe-S-cluster containining protein
VPALPAITLDAAGSPRANELLTTMLRALQGALRAAPGDDAALEQGLRDGLAAYDAFVAHVVAAHPMACRAGCTACCHDDPDGVTGVELERLARVVDGWPDGPAIRARFAALAARRTDPAAWRRLRLPCPLLDAAGRCRAYEARPLACRAFHALTPAEWCDPGDARYEERVNPHVDPPRVILQILQALSARRGLVVATDLHTGMGRNP